MTFDQLANKLGGYNGSPGIGYDMPEWYLSQIESKVGQPPDRIEPRAGGVLIFYEVDGGDALIVGGVRDERLRCAKILFFQKQV